MLCFETSQKLFFGLSKTLFRETFASRYDESWLYMFVAIFSRKFGEGQAEEQAKLNVYFQGGGPGNLTNPIKCLPAKQEVAPERKPVMWPACLLGYHCYHEQIYDHLESSDWFFRIKRHCCPTWVPQKTNMEFASVSRKYNFISRRMNDRFRLEEFRSTAIHIPTYYLAFCLTYMAFYLAFLSCSRSRARCQDFTRWVGKTRQVQRQTS